MLRKARKGFGLLNYVFLFVPCFARPDDRVGRG
jgi:hypothetical protein